ncbi:MAG: nuclease-related domain-containing protein [Solirubrobacteraceae bacterium]
MFDELVVSTLEARCPTVPMLHRVRCGGAAEIDHVAVAASGVYVIAVTPESGGFRVSRPRFGPAILRVGRRDHSALVDSLHDQVAAVEAALADVDVHVPVRGVLCFAGAGAPLLRVLTIDGVPLTHARQVARLLRRPGPLTGTRARQVLDALDTSLVAA